MSSDIKYGRIYGHRFERHDNGWACECGQFLSTGREEARRIARAHRAEIRGDLDRLIRNAWTMRILPKVNLAEAGCWEYLGHRNTAGYGVSHIDKQRQVHRISAYLHLGLNLDDPKTVVCHRCDNPPCFNPEHLFLGTNRDNKHDSMDKGRADDPGVRWASKTHCPAGHPYSAENTHFRKDKTNRRCKICTRASNRRSRARQGAKS